MNSNQTNDPILALDKKSDNSNPQSILPRRGWQDKQAFARAVVKTKRALDLAEIKHLIG